jgi:hypothetical protein
LVAYGATQVLRSNVTESELVSQLADRAALQDLLATLVRADERGDYELIASCYTEDSYDDHGRFRGTGREFADYICHKSFSVTSRFRNHNLGQSLFEIDGDQAFGETYFVFHMQTETGTVLEGCGRYLDDFVRVDGKWLIKRRRCLEEWTGEVEAKTLAKPAHALVSSRDLQDPLYEGRAHLRKS